ncbi:MAG: hypothetical protein RL497_893 [Pseudomonadota bacterium]|jgi:hypothetical protein
MHTLLKCIVGGLLASSAIQASAVTLDFHCITPNTSASCAIGENQFSVDMLAGSTANQVNFTFRNTGIYQSGIDAVYFDAGSLASITGLIDKDQGGGLAGVDFTEGDANPSHLPNGNNINPNFVVSAGLLADSDAPVSKNAINTGEWLTVQFNISSGRTFNDLITELTTGDLRVGVHALGFANNGASVSLVNNAPVPVPAAFWLLGSGLLALLTRLRKASR